MHYVKDTNHLAELCSKLNKSKFLAIDTEFIREKTYWPKLCLIQVFNGEDKIIIVSAIDNLIKGAAGQAVQCFNIAENIEETVSLV